MPRLVLRRGGAGVVLVGLRVGARGLQHAAPDVDHGVRHIVESQIENQSLHRVCGKFVLGNATEV